MDLAVPVDYWVKLKESEKRDKYVELAWEQKTTLRKCDCDSNFHWYTRNHHQKVGKGTGRFENKKTSEDYPNYNIFNISQNTEKSPGDLRGFTVIQTPVRDH